MRARSSKAPVIIKLFIDVFRTHDQFRAIRHHFCGAREEVSTWEVATICNFEVALGTFSIGVVECFG